MLGIPSDYLFMYFSLCDFSTCIVQRMRSCCDRVFKRSLYLFQIPYASTCIIIHTRPYMYLGHYYYDKFEITHMYANARISHIHIYTISKNATSLSVVVTNLDSRCLAQCYGFMNTNPLYIFLSPFFRPDICFTIPVLSPLSHSFFPFSHSLCPLDPSTEPFICATDNSELIPFISPTGSFLFMCPISRMIPAYRTLARHRTTKPRTEYQENYNMREGNREMTI